MRHDLSLAHLQVEALRLPLEDESDCENDEADSNGHDMTGSVAGSGAHLLSDMDGIMHPDSHGDSSFGHVPIYVYSPIADSQTRLLTILPGSSMDKLNTRLTPMDIRGPASGSSQITKPARRQRRQYEAVSYCWGTSKPSVPIKCDGASLLVTETVFRALHDLRDQDRPRHIWIDAICIDQQNLVERSSQVSRMLSIFLEATLVIVWLEGFNHTAYYAFDEVAHVTATDEADSSIKSQRPSWNSPESLHAGLVVLLSNPWFGRVWVKQEIWAAREVLVMYEGRMMPWAGLVKAAEWIDRLDAQIESHEPFVNPLDAFRLSWGQLQVSQFAHQKDGLLDLMTRTAGGGCSDNRDYAYSILGMSDYYDTEWPHHERIVVDYTRAACDVFQDVVRFIVASDNNLEVLLLRATYGGIVDGRALPSWCPDWSARMDRRPHELMPPTMGRSFAVGRPSFSVNDAGQPVMRLSGIQLAELGDSGILQFASFETPDSAGSGASSERASKLYKILAGELQTLQQRTIGRRLKWRLSERAAPNDLMVMVQGSEDEPTLLLIRPFMEDPSSYVYIGPIAAEWLDAWPGLKRLAQCFALLKVWRTWGLV